VACWCARPPILTTRRGRAVSPQPAAQRVEEPVGSGMEQQVDLVRPEAVTTEERLPPVSKLACCEPLSRRRAKLASRMERGGENVRGVPLRLA
jgi:hypothetical protein